MSAAGWDVARKWAVSAGWLVLAYPVFRALADLVAALAACQADVLCR